MIRLGHALLLPLATVALPEVGNPSDSSPDKLHPVETRLFVEPSEVEIESCKIEVKSSPILHSGPCWKPPDLPHTPPDRDVGIHFHLLRRHLLDKYLHFLESLGLS